MAEFWDEWRGSLDGRPTMWIKRLLKLPIWWWAGKLRSCRVDLHKFVAEDDYDCYHSHPAWAIRIVLWGGYIEEVYDDATYANNLFGALRVWFPGRVGVIRPSFAHRVHELCARTSYSLWLRGPICADVKLLGDGWKAQQMSSLSTRKQT